MTLILPAVYTIKLKIHAVLRDFVNIAEQTNFVHPRNTLEHIAWNGHLLKVDKY